MTKKMFNSDLETTGSITSGGPVVASTLTCPVTSGSLVVGGSLTADSVSCEEGTIGGNLVASVSGFVTLDRLDSVTDLFFRHTPSVFSRKELVFGGDVYSNIQSFDTIPASLHSSVGSVQAATDYSHAALTLRSRVNSGASTAQDAFTIPFVEVRTVALDSEAQDSVASMGVSISSQIGEYPVGHSSKVSLHIRPDLARIDGPLEVTGGVTAFTGAHLYPTNLETLSTLEEGMCLVRGADGLVYPSSASNSSTVVGLFIEAVRLEPTSEDYSGDKNSYNAYSEFTLKVASVGDSRIGRCRGFNVCNENGDIQPGDLLVTSSTPGYLMKQDDDIIRSKTVGKAMEEVTFDANGQATGIYGFIYCG